MRKEDFVTHRELKKMAKEIAACEEVIRSTQDFEEKQKAENKIMRLTENIYSLEDMAELDEMILDMLKK